MNLTASTTKIFVVVEAFPESEQRLGTGLGTGIEQNADFGVQNAANGSEEPSVRVDLLGVLLLQAKHHLNGRQSAGAVIVRADELLVGCDGKLCGVLELSLVSCASQSGQVWCNLQCEQSSRFRRCLSS